MTDRTNTNTDATDNEIGEDELEQVSGGACMVFVDSAGCSNTTSGGSGGSTTGGDTGGSGSTPTGGTGGRSH